MNDIVAIVQARMGSSRLPGKVLMNLIGQPMLFHEIARISRSKRISRIVIATTTSEKDDEIVRACKSYGWNFFRGCEQDVLDRYYQAAKETDADFVVRLTSDCPLIEPVVIDKVIDTFLESSPRVDYASNFIPDRRFPRGLDTEIMSFPALERSWKEDRNPAFREHVTQYILRNPDKFRITGITNPRDLSHLRWTVDTKEDFLLVNAIYTYFGHNQFTCKDVLDLLIRRPELLLINGHIRQKEVAPS